MRRYLLPALLPGAAVLVVVSGFLPLAGLAELWGRVWHTLLFVTAMLLPEPWASLATLLWADRLRGPGVPVSWP